MVVVEAVNRLSRRVVDSLQSWELLTFSGVKLLSASEGEQDFLRVMLNSLGAQMFSQNVAEHTRRGLVGMLEREGRVHSLAYGYRKRATPPKSAINREIDPATAPIVLRIFEGAANGRSGDEIARGPNADGIPAPQGGIWYASAIRGGSKFGSGLLRNARLRRALWMAAQVAIAQRANSFRDKFERYNARNRHNADLRRMAYTAIAAKMARTDHAVVKDGQPYRPFFEGTMHGGTALLS